MKSNAKVQYFCYTEAKDVKKTLYYCDILEKMIIRIRKDVMVELLCSHKKVVSLRRKSNHLTPCFLPFHWRFDTFNGIIVQ